jgi:hypothetical protein
MIPKLALSSKGDFPMLGTLVIAALERTFEKSLTQIAARNNQIQSTIA